MSQIVLRPATQSDCGLLFEWVNEKETRKFSLNSDPIPIETHEDWFSKKMAKPEICQIFIAQMDDTSVGQIRFDKIGNQALISYSVNEHQRGRKIGRVMVQMAIHCMIEKWPDVKHISGIVKSENIASQKVFDYLNFGKNELGDTIEYILDL